MSSQDTPVAASTFKDSYQDQYDGNEAKKNFKVRHSHKIQRTGSNFLKKMQDEAKQVYSTLDKSGSGSISTKDLTQYFKGVKSSLEGYGISLKPEYFRNLIEQMDENSEGRVSAAKFETSMAQLLDLQSRAKAGKLAIPNFDEFANDMTALYNEVKDVKAGKNASYIPQLAKADPDIWAVAIETVDGQKWSHGDDEVEFSIQSCSKPLVYCMALEELGAEIVQKYVGCEPSGARFNAFTLNDDNKPFNPFINTGAIMTCSLIQRSKNAADRFADVQNFFTDMASGAKVGFSNSIFLSERMSADRNKALSHFMNEHHAFPPNTRLEDVLDFYFQTCSLEVTVKVLASIAATLANGGVSTATGKRILSSETVRKCLILLFSCGMYDYSGMWAFNVGLPAKSGVSGCIFVVIPNVMGMCTLSPPLDFRGNSVRGIEFCTKLAEKYKFHIFTQLVGMESASELKAADKARKKKQQKSKDALADAGKDNTTRAHQLCSAAQRGDLHELQILVINLDIPVDTDDYDHRTAIHLASAEGHMDVISFLVANGADINIQDRWGNTPMDEAVYANRTEAVQYLYSLGARTNNRTAPDMAQLAEGKKQNGGH